MTFLPNIKFLMNCMPGRCCRIRWNILMSGSKSAVAYRFALAGLPNPPGGHFFLPIVEGLNRADFEVYCYYNYIVRDEWTERFERSSDHFHHVVHWNDDQLTDQIRADKIDILLEGAGHMSGNRLLVVARKPAPIQVGWPLYPNTSGLSAVDYRVVDRHSALPSADEFCTEEIIRLPDTHFCYRPLERDVEPLAHTPRRTQRLCDVRKL